MVKSNKTRIALALMLLCATPVWIYAVIWMLPGWIGFVRSTLGGLMILGAGFLLFAAKQPPGR